MTTLPWSSPLPHSPGARLAVTAATCLAVSLLVASAWLARENVRGVEAGNRLGDQARAAQLASETLLSTIKDAETGQRGYLLTGDPASLKPYEVARSRLEADFARLEHGPLMTPERRERVRRIRDLARARLAELERTVALQEAGQAEVARAVVRTNQGKRTMEAIRAEVDALEADAEGKLARARAHANSKRAWAGVVGLAALAALLLGWVALVQRRERLLGAAAFAKLERFTRAFGLAQGMMRDTDGRITFWDGGTQHLYGYTPQEALGRISHELLRTEFPHPLEEIEATLARDGHWHGELVHRRKDGAEVAVASHWALHPGRAGEADAVIEVNHDITALKRGEAALRDSEARLRTATDNSRVGLVVVDTERRYVFANRAYTDILGIPTEDIVGQRVADVLAPMYEAQIRPRLDRAFQGQRVLYELVKPATPGRTEGYFAVTYEPGRTAAGDPVVVVVVADVTERTLAARALAESERLLRLALGAAALGTWRWEVGGSGELVWDARCKALFGLVPDAPLDYDVWARAIFPEDRPRAEAGIVRALDPTDPRDEYVCEYRVVHPNGTVLWLAATGRTLFEPDAMAPARRRAVRIMGAISDVTERRRAEQERQRADALLRAIVETAPGLIYAKDRQGRMLLANSATLDLIGKPWTEVEGRTDLEFLADPAQAGTVMANDRRMMEQGHSETVEELIGAENGHARVWLSTKTPLRDTDSLVIGVVGVSVEITERKQAEERMRLMLHELNHRVKNTLATVQAIASQTLRGADPAVRHTLEARLMALAAAHDVLTREGWEGADLDDVVSGALAPHGGRSDQRFQVSGPKLRLVPRAALALAMGLHELATNAVKYGALSGTGPGHVTIHWQVVPGAEPLFHLAWAERGGPPVTPPVRRGFGMRLVERSLAQDLGGSVRIAFDPEGITCTIGAPLDQVAAPAAVMHFPRVGGVRKGQQ